VSGRVAVVGALGRIGAAIGGALTRQGYDTVGLARDPSRPGRRRVPFPVQPLPLDQPARLAAALAGTDTVFYCAGAHHGATRELHELDVLEINTIAAQRAALAAALGGARRFVYLSSTAAMAMADDAYAGAYVRSKWLAEQVLPTVFPAGLSLLRLGWVIDETDRVAYEHLWPASQRQVIVGGLPVPMVSLPDVAAAAAVLAEPQRLADPALTGRIDLIGGCPSQAELYTYLDSLAPGRVRVLDAGTVHRLARLAALRGEGGEPPTWLTQAAPEADLDWGRYGLSLRSWQECVLALHRVHGRGGAEPC
jgi:nucleoside-diphosphate-sugar epimerase